MGSVFSVDAARAAELFKADTTAPAFGKPWGAHATSGPPPGEDEELYCVATWGLGSVAIAPAFLASTAAVAADIERSVALGSALSVGLSSEGFKAETVTVWRARADSAAFFRSPNHVAAMRVVKMEFHLRKCVVRGRDLPHDGESGRAFWTKVKDGGFPPYEEGARPSRE